MEGSDRLSAIIFYLIVTSKITLIRKGIKMKNRRFQAAFLLIVCFMTLLTVSNTAETTSAFSNFSSEPGLAFWVLGEYCEIGKNRTERFGWTFVSSYWGTIIPIAIGATGIGALGIGMGVAL